MTVRDTGLLLLLLLLLLSQFIPVGFFLFFFARVFTFNVMSSSRMFM